MRHHLPAHRWMLPLLLCLAAAAVPPLDAQEVREAQSTPPPEPAPPAQSVQPAQSAQPAVPRYQTGVDLVAVNVTVVDRLQRLVPGLPRERFEVFEDGVRQEISYFEHIDVPLDVVLLIDTSSSMYAKLRAIRLAAAAFARALRPGDRAAVLTFKNRITHGMPLTAEPRMLESAIRGITAGGGTSLYDSIYVALRGLSSGSFLPGRDAAHDDRLRRRAIVVLTDGTDTTSLMTFEMLQEEARRANVMIYSICLLESSYGVSRADGAPLQSALDVNLREISRDTGGLALAVKTESEIVSAYDRVTSELTHQYLLAYSPKTRRTAPSPGFHRVVVQLRGVPDATIRARTGYQGEPWHHQRRSQ